jgi:hypothetical protein
VVFFGLQGLFATGGISPRLHCQGRTEGPFSPHADPDAMTKLLPFSDTWSIEEEENAVTPNHRHHHAARAQYHLRQCFIFLNGQVMSRPEVMIPQAHNMFDAAGKLTDPPTRDVITAHLIALKAWVLRLR